MGRLLLWVLLGFIAWMLLRPKRRSAPPPSAARGPAAPAAPVVKPEVMVDCAACGLHFPASEAIRDDAWPYCSSAHRALGPRRAD